MKGKKKNRPKTPTFPGPAAQAWIQKELPTDPVHRNRQSIASHLQSLGPHTPASGKTAAIPYAIQPYSHCADYLYPPSAKKFGMVRFIPTSRDLQPMGSYGVLSCGVYQPNGQRGECHRKKGNLPAFMYTHPALQCRRSTDAGLPTILHQWVVIVPEKGAPCYPGVKFGTCWNCATKGLSCKVQGERLFRCGKGTNEEWQLVSGGRANSKQDWTLTPSIPQSAKSTKRLGAGDADGADAAKRRRVNQLPSPLPSAIIPSSLPPPIQLDPSPPSCQSPFPSCPTAQGVSSDVAVPAPTSPYASLASTAASSLALGPPALPRTPFTPSSPKRSAVDPIKEAVDSMEVLRTEILALRAKQTKTEAAAAEAAKVKMQARTMLAAAKRHSIEVELMKCEVAKEKEAVAAAMARVQKAADGAKKAVLDKFKRTVSALDNKRTVSALDKAKAIKKDGERLLEEVKSLGEENLRLAEENVQVDAENLRLVEQAVTVDAENKLLKEEVRALQAEVKALRFLRSVSESSK